MGKLRDLPNISKVIETRLVKAGINDEEALKQVGSKEAFIKLRLLEGDTCFNTLCALEGAIQGIRWHYLDSATKAELKVFFDSLKGQEF